MLLNNNFSLLAPRAGQQTVAPIAGPGAQAPEPAPYTPDYAGLIQSNPEYLAYKNNATLDVNQAAARRKAALQALAVQYGGLGGGFKDAYGDVDATTMELAGKNQFSDVARLNRSYSQGVEQLKRALAARGALQSGDLGHGLAQADYQRGAGEYDLGQQFSNAAQQAINDYLGVEANARRGEPAALSAAAQAVYQNPANRPYTPAPQQQQQIAPSVLAPRRTSVQALKRSLPYPWTAGL